MKNLLTLMMAMLWCTACMLPVNQKEVLAPLTTADAGEIADAGGVGAGEVDAGAPTCVAAADLNDWPVKVLFLVDNRGSLCIIDPPGTQGGGAGFCDLYGRADGGATVPARVRALEAFWATRANVSNVWGAVSWWNPGAHGFSFQPVSTPFPMTTASELTNTLGKLMDLQGLLAVAKEVLEADLLAATPSLRAHTKYEVVLVSTGTAYPICSADDARTTWATPAAPDGVWPDSAGTADFCNMGSPLVCDPVTGLDTQGNICIPGFVPGGDRNQPATLRQQARDLFGLQAQYGVGAVSLHTRLLFNQAAIDACGPICQDLLGMPPADAHQVATFTLQMLATEGHGTFVDPGTPEQLDLTTLDTSPLLPVCP
jgi:hypothetical protein